MGVVLLPLLLYVGILLAALSSAGGLDADSPPLRTRPWTWHDVEQLAPVLPWVGVIAGAGVCAGLYRSHCSRRRGHEIEEQLQADLELARLRLAAKREQEESGPAASD